MLPITFGHRSITHWSIFIYSFVFNYLCVLSASNHNKGPSRSKHTIIICFVRFKSIISSEMKVVRLPMKVSCTLIRDRMCVCLSLLRPYACTPAASSCCLDDLLRIPNTISQRSTFNPGPSRLSISYVKKMPQKIRVNHRLSVATDMIPRRTPFPLASNGSAVLKRSTVRGITTFS